MAMKLTSGNFETEVYQAEVPVLVDFYADWCGLYVLSLLSSRLKETSLEAISLQIGFPSPENFVSYSVITFPSR